MGRGDMKCKTATEDSPILSNEHQISLKFVKELELLPLPLS